MEVEVERGLRGNEAGGQSTTCTVINFPYFYTYANRVRVTFFVPLY